MHGSNAVLVIAVFLASAVEMVEALTIVVAVGVTRGWRSAAEGTVTAVVVLGALGGRRRAGPRGLRPARDPAGGGGRAPAGVRAPVAAQVGPAGAGLKAKHDEDLIFRHQVAELSSGHLQGSGRDSTAFTVAFKGVFLEGLEVVIIVLTLGATDHRLGLAALAAAAAAVIVAVVGAVVARQLSGVPENALKAVVGVMLVSYGTFWTGEGIGVHWPGADASLLVLVGVYAAAAWFLGPGAGPGATGRYPCPVTARPWCVAALVAFGRFWWDFLVGDTPELLVGSLVAIGVVALVVHNVGARAVVIGCLPFLVIALLALSALRARSRSEPRPGDDG